MVASFVKKGSIIADIGTDHAYIPAYLVLNGVCDKAFAADIGKGPLLNAAETVEKYALEDKITLILSDGLKHINLDLVDTVILAGMGGDLIADILSCAKKEKLRKIHIIAQPQSHSEKVRSFLMENGFEIEEEKICLDQKHVYIAMSAVYTGKSDFPPYYEHYGELVKNKSELTEKFFENQLVHLRIKAEALSKAGSPEADILKDIIENTEKRVGENKNES